MIMNGFDLKKMSDETLNEKHNELLKKVNWMSRFSTSVEAIHQLQLMIQMINDERRERMFMEQWRMVYPHISEPIESDPDLSQAYKEKKEKAKPVEKVSARIKMKDRREATPIPVPVATRTLTPIIPSSKEDES